MRFILFSNQKKDPGLEVTDRLSEMIRARGGGVSLIREPDEAVDDVIDPELMKTVDAVIVLGGDGTLLRASHAIGNSDVPMIGVNLGTTGFLTEVECGAMDTMVERLFAGDYTVETRMKLKGVIRKGGAPAETFTALNDIVVIREGVLRLIAIKIYVNDIFLDTYEADGVILATPTGSTGYNLSAGGPIVAPQARLIALTPVSPHSLLRKSLVFDSTDRIKIVLEEKRKTQINEAIVSFDGYRNYEISVGDEVEICASETVLRMIRLDGRSFYEVIGRKLNPR